MTLISHNCRYFDVETDTHKLATHCCGLDYRLEGTDPPLKPDSEYPDWLWTMDVKRPLPSSDQLEPGTMEFFLRCREEYVLRERVKGQKRKRGKKN